MGVRRGEKERGEKNLLLLLLLAALIMLISSISSFFSSGHPDKTHPQASY